MLGGTALGDGGSGVCARAEMARHCAVAGGAPTAMVENETRLVVASGATRTSQAPRTSLVHGAEGLKRVGGLVMVAVGAAGGGPVTFVLVSTVAPNGLMRRTSEPSPRSICSSVPPAPRSRRRTLPRIEWG